MVKTTFRQKLSTWLTYFIIFPAGLACTLVYSGALIGRRIAGKPLQPFGGNLSNRLSKNFIGIVWATWGTIAVGLILFFA